MTATPTKALNAALDPRYRRPRMSWMEIERTKALRGIEKCSLTLENVLGKGMAESRENAHVAREAAQQIETAQNMLMPKTMNHIPKPPALEPIIRVNISPIGCPLVMLSKVPISGNVKRIGSKKRIPHVKPMGIDSAMALGRF